MDLVSLFLGIFFQLLQGVLKAATTKAEKVHGFPLMHCSTDSASSNGNRMLFLVLSAFIGT